MYQYPLPARIDLSRWRVNAWQVDAAVAKVPLLRVEIVKRSDHMNSFVVLPAPLGGRAQLLMVRPKPAAAKDFENLAETPATFVTLASIQLTHRRLGRAYVVTMEVCKAW